MNILVVDDDELNQRMMDLLLRLYGHSVDFASNGLDAFEAVKLRRYDVVFMDLQMPVMNGIEASRRIRDWEANGVWQTFIVALTASYLPEEGSILFEAGIDNYISKPFEVEYLERILKYRSDVLYRQATSPEQETGSNDLLDTRKGLRSVGGDPEIYRELLSDFIEEIPGRIENIRKFFAEQDVKALSRAAHNLKGVSANLGAFRLSRCAGRIDKQSTTGYTESLGELIAEIGKVELELLEFTRDFLKEQKMTPG